MASTDFEFERQFFRDYYNDNIHLLQDATTFFQSLVIAVLRDSTIEIDAVTARVKDREECISKFTRKYRDGLDKDGTPYSIGNWISDLIGVRVVCLYDRDIYAVESLLTGTFTVVHETDKKKAIEESEASFGYKGVHLDLSLGSGRDDLPEYKRYRGFQFEVQIRTISQDAWSTLDHKIKYKQNIPLDLKRRINRLAALFELADQEFVHIFDAAKVEVQRGAEVAAQLQKHQTIAKNAGQEIIDVFGFMGVARRLYPNYPFLEELSDMFLQDILRAKDSLTTAEFASVLERKLPIVKSYKATVPFRMNPATEIRHALYATDPSTYVGLLFDTQRRNFDKWLSSTAEPAA